MQCAPGATALPTSLRRRATYAILRYQGVLVADLLIRNIPADDLDLIDEQARQLGLSRTEYLRRRLHQIAHGGQGTVTVADFQRLADLLPDLTDPQVMDDAWS